VVSWVNSCGPVRAQQASAACAVLVPERLAELDAARLLPGHGQPFTGSPHAAAQQARQAGVR
jgi:hypothetical protein